MRAWVARGHGPPDVLSFEDIQEPAPRADRVRIAVRAAAVNFFDLLAVAGTYQVESELPFIPGAEVAGVVLDAPEDGTFAPGDRVAAQVAAEGLSSGGFAELSLADPSLVIPLPPEMPFVHAAAFFVNYSTGWLGLHRRARVRPGEVVLVHAGAGGVGSAAIHLAKAAGATVIATAGTRKKAELCKGLGADFTVDYGSGDFVDKVKQLTSGRGADVVYDPVGGEIFNRSTKCIAFEGRIISVGFTSGRIPSLAVNHALVKNYAVLGLHAGLYRNRAPAVVDEAVAAIVADYRRGVYRPYISRIEPLDELVNVLEDVAARRTTGKVVLTTTVNGG